MRYLVPGFFVSDSVMWISRKWAAVLCHTFLLWWLLSKHKEPNKNELHHQKPRTKEIISFVPSSHTKAWHMSFSILLDLPSLPLSLYLIFLLFLYPVTIQHLKSYAAMPSCLYELWLLYPHHISYSMAPYSLRLSLTICWPPALASSTFEVCHLVFTLCV